jgi:hypothetical protein
MKFDKQWPDEDLPDKDWLDDACRREVLARLIAGGALAFMPWQLANAGWFSWGPKKLSTDKSIHSLEGEALVNGRPADLQTRIRQAPVINHSNSELKLLEAIVGRKVPKGFGVKPYNK